MGTSDHVQPHHCYFEILALESLITGDPLVSPVRETKIGAQGIEQEVGLQAR